MEKFRLVETFEDTPSISLTEGDSTNPKSSRVDGKYIIGMIEGQFFKPDGMSRNGRWYPRSLWTKALNRAETKNRLANSTMFGEIGHSDGPVEDMTLRQGCASHFIDALWIDEAGRGMGRAYILGTPTGQLLKIYLGAGCKLKVSTRGEGSYKEGEFHDGCPVVDDESYDFQTVDFVLNPGFLETSAVLKESYNKLTKELTNTKVIQETIAHVKKEGEKRMEFDMNAYVTELKAELASFKAENKALNEQLQAKNNELLQSQLTNNAEKTKLNEELKPYRNLKVSAKTITENFKKLQNDLKKVTAEKVKISEELNDFKSVCGSKKELESAVYLSTKALKMIEEYRKLGTPQEFEQALNDVKILRETATKAEKLAQCYTSLKETVDKKTTSLNRVNFETEQIRETLEKTEKLISKYKATKHANYKLAEKLDMVEGVIKKATTAIKDLTRCRKLSEQLLVKHKQLLEENKQLKIGKNSQLSESVQTDKQSAIKLSEKFGCTVETAAKLINKNGLQKATKMLESINIKNLKPKFKSSKKLVEEVAQLDKVSNIPMEKTAKDYLSDGLIKNYFNKQALGQEVIYNDFTKLDGTKNAGEEKIKNLFKKYGMKYEVEEAPKGLDMELTPDQAEAEAKKLLNK